MLKIILIDDDQIFLELFKILLIKLDSREKVIHMVTSGQSALEIISREKSAIVFTDLIMPGMNGFEFTEKALRIDPNLRIIITTAMFDSYSVLNALRLGAFDFLRKPLDNKELEFTYKKALESIRIREENLIFKKDLSAHREDKVFQTFNEKFKKQLINIQKAAETDSTIFIKGENGTGKGIMASYIHNISKRAKNPLFSVNCATLQEALLESELFGHKKGAFTGAYKDHKGYFEVSNHSTLFLDEISTLSMNIQAKLLRVLEEKEFTPLGDTQSIKTDVRIIAATNQELEKSIEEGIFRKDLYFRLNIFEITVPPLRERFEDILPIFSLFLQDFSMIIKKRVHSIRNDAKEILTSYAWPGNIRELKNVAERAVILCLNDEPITPEILPEQMKKMDIKGIQPQITGSESFAEAKKKIIQKFEEEFLTERLKENRGNMELTARRIGLHPVFLRQKVAKLKINIHGIKSEFQD
jgi:DNA-binding NtrC family response regulator